MIIARRFNAGLSTSVQCRPVGTVETFTYMILGHGWVHSLDRIQASLRDAVPHRSLPGVETPGYCQASLRLRSGQALRTRGVVEANSVVSR